VAGIEGSIVVVDVILVLFLFFYVSHVYMLGCTCIHLYFSSMNKAL